MSDGVSLSSSLPGYNQPTKRLARLQSLGHAVDLFTTRREDVAVVSADHPSRIKASLAASDIMGDAVGAEGCSDIDITSWQTFRASSIGTRGAADLTIASSRTRTSDRMMQKFFGGLCGGRIMLNSKYVTLFQPFN